MEIFNDGAATGIIVIVVIALAVALLGKKKKGSASQSLVVDQMPQHTRLFRDAVVHIQRFPGYAVDLKSVHRITCSKESHPTQPGALMGAGSTITVYPAAFPYINARGNKTRLIASLIMHEVAHNITGADHGGEFGAYYKKAIGVMDLPYVEYQRV